MRMETDRLILRRFEGSKGIHRIYAECEIRKTVPPGGCWKGWDLKEKPI